jgi:hypothetical protein
VAPEKLKITALLENKAHVECIFELYWFRIRVSGKILLVILYLQVVLKKHLTQC